MTQSLFTFEPGFFARIWGGDRLRTVLGMPAPAGAPIGEAWLVSDHASFESPIANGEWRGQTLHALLEADPAFLLGDTARPTPHGRFPLLLKVLDAAETLSVQVHPDDEAAAALGEPDAGKTEMWHVLAADPGSELICGLAPRVSPDTFFEAARAGNPDALLRRFPSPAGTTAFVAAGTVHAIGAGILLAEIQQNSDLTYRIHDWNRADSQGRPRELHLDKAARVTDPGAAHGGPARPLTCEGPDGPVTLLGACRYFASALLPVSGSRRHSTGGHSFHLILSCDGPMEISAGDETISLARCQAALIPAGAGAFCLTGRGNVLDYYVPRLREDIVRPLQAAGHGAEAIIALGGGSGPEDLGSVLRS